MNTDSESGRKKVFIIDTNVSVHDPEAVLQFQDNDVVIPIWQIEELDHFKNQPDGRGMNSRTFSRWLEPLTSLYLGRISRGIPLPGGGSLFIDYNGSNMGSLPAGLLHNNDNRLILIAKEWQKKSYRKVVIVSKDFNVRIKARALGIDAEDYESDKPIRNIKDIYTGIKDFEIKDLGLWNSLKAPLSEERFFKLELLNGEISNSGLVFNQCCRFFLSGTEKQIATIFEGSGFRLVKKFLPNKEGERIKPRNSEQFFAYELLMNQQILVVTLVGGPGTGKTLMALLAGYEQLGKPYRQIIVYRPNVELGNSLGFLKGGLEEKFEPWKRPIFDNLKLIVKDGDLGKKEKEINKKDSQELSSINCMISQEMLSIEPINYVQGRTLHDSFVIVDEVQNFTPKEAKVLLARIGQNSKIILTGDITQIANPYLDQISNGLTHTVESWKGQKIFGHIMMKKSERSLVADLADQLM